MVSANDALVTIVAIVCSVIAFGYVFATPSNILLVTVAPGVLLPVAYVLDRRRRAGAVGLQHGEDEMLVVGTASAIAWGIALLFLPVLAIIAIATAFSVFSIVLVVRAWQRLARTP